MKSYFALSYSPLHELKIWSVEDLPHVLTSYHVIQDMKIDIVKQQFGKRVSFLDSGAFSAFTKGITIDIDKYIKFIKDTDGTWEVYASLDVIGDWKKSRENTEYMESKGLNPLPVFHYGSPESELKRLIKSYDYIALGGLVPLAMQRKKMEAWLDYCFSIIKADCRVHGLGVNSLWAWKKYPFYSVDATSWNQGMKFGRVIEAKGLNQITLKDDRALFLNKGKDWRHRTALNIIAYNKLAKEYNKLWESRGVKWD